MLRVRPMTRLLQSRQAAEVRRGQAQVILDRAIKRGELGPAVDRDLALDLLPAPLYWRMVVLGNTPTRRQLVVEAAAINAALRASIPVMGSHIKPWDQTASWP